MRISTEKVQQWLDACEDEILLTSSASSCSTAPRLLLSDNEDDDAVQNAATVIIISSSSSSSDDMEVMVVNIDRIWNHTEAMLNQNTFDAALDAACV